MNVCLFVNMLCTIPTRRVSDKSDINEEQVVRDLCKPAPCQNEKRKVISKLARCDGENSAYAEVVPCPSPLTSVCGVSVINSNPSSRVNPSFMGIVEWNPWGVALIV
jgi:hypothetical protein